MRRFAHTVVLVMVALVAVVATACQRQAYDPLVEAALEVYNRYAGHSDQLTVAYIGDFKANGNTYNAIVFEANDDEQWDWLKKEFAMSSIAEALPMGAPVGSIFMTTNELDIVQELEDGDLDIVRAFIDSVMNSPDEPRSAFRVLSNEEFFDSTGLSIEELAVQQLSNPYEDKPDGVGYLVQADIENRVVYLFFYRTAAEMMELLVSLNQ